MTHCKTKQIKEAYKQYCGSNLTELWQCYGTHSYNKDIAMQYCKKLAKEYNSFLGCYILSYNTNIFTVGFIGEIDGEAAFFYITRDYDRFIYLDELED